MGLALPVTSPNGHSEGCYQDQRCSGNPCSAEAVTGVEGLLYKP